MKTKQNEFIIKGKNIYISNLIYQKYKAVARKSINYINNQIFT